MKTLKFARIAAATAALVAGGAHAALITNWDIMDTAVFVESSIVPSNGTPSTYPYPVLSNADTSLYWGVPATSSGQSHLDISSTNQTAVPLNTLVNTVTVSHSNFPITNSDSWLTRVDILATISLNPNPLILGFPDPLVGPGSTTFMISFFETPNLSSGGFCADGSTAGINGCPDIFVVNKEVPVDFSFIVPDYDGLGAYEYFVTFAGTGFQDLSNTACNSLGFASGCKGFLTEENQVSTAEFGLSIDGRQVVPEPGSLALLGLGLLGLGAVRRRKSVK